MSIQPYEEKRPWGGFTQFTHNELSTVKILKVTAGEAFSLQRHSNREEFWLVINGKAKVTIGDSTKEAKAGDHFFVPVETLHQVEGITDVEILEIALGNFDEDDIVRIKDKYGRK